MTCVQMRCLHETKGLCYLSSVFCVYSRSNDTNQRLNPHKAVSMYTSVSSKKQKTKPKKKYKQNTYSHHLASRNFHPCLLGRRESSSSSSSRLWPHWSIGRLQGPSRHPVPEDSLVIQVVKASSSRAADLGSILAYAMGLFPGRVIPVT